MPVVVGGTGLYIRALAEGLFREPALDLARRHALDAFTARLEDLEPCAGPGGWTPGSGAADAGGPRGRWRSGGLRPPALLVAAEARARGVLDPWYIVLTVPRAVLHQRIARRAEEMMRRGLIEEVASVLAEGHMPQAPGLDGIGIREAVEYLHGGRTRESVAEAVA